MSSEKKHCNYCKKENFSDSVFCGYCGNAFPPSSFKPEATARPPEAGAETCTVTEKHTSLNDENKALCPKCDSVSLVCNKRGYSFTKGIIGSLFLGKIGLLAGTIGSKKTEIICIKCGHKFEL